MVDGAYCGWWNMRTSYLSSSSSQWSAVTGRDGGKSGYSYTQYIEGKEKRKIHTPTCTQRKRETGKHAFTYRLEDMRQACWSGLGVVAWTYNAIILHIARKYGILLRLRNNSLFLNNASTGYTFSFIYFICMIFLSQKRSIIVHNMKTITKW